MFCIGAENRTRTLLIYNHLRYNNTQMTGQLVCKEFIKIVRW